MLKLKPMESEQNLWKVVVEKHGFQEDEELISNGRVVGLVMTYVDDIFISGKMKVMKVVAEEFQKTWKTSFPEGAVGSVPVRFLGVEVTSRCVEGEDQMECRMTQESYIKEEQKLLITKGQAMMEPDTMEPSAESVKTSQKLMGKVLWLVTRTRPDLMFGVSRMGGNVLKSSQRIKETAAQMRFCLKGTYGEGFSYKEKAESSHILRLFKLQSCPSFR